MPGRRSTQVIKEDWTRIRESDLLLPERVAIEGGSLHGALDEPPNPIRQWHIAAKLPPRSQDLRHDPALADRGAKVQR